MLGTTKAPFSRAMEICAGYISKKRRVRYRVKKKKTDDGRGSWRSPTPYDADANGISLSFVAEDAVFESMDGPNVSVTFDMIGGKDACTGDSGAPLWVEVGKRTRRAFAVGVVSRGFNCASHNLPGIYVRVKKFLGWIMDVIGEEGSCT